MMPKYPVLLVIHIMYGLHLSVTSFKNVEPRNNKCVRWKNIVSSKTYKHGQLLHSPTYPTMFANLPH